MSNSTRLIMIWGIAIFLYIILSKSSGSVSVANSLFNGGDKVTRTLQGR